MISLTLTDRQALETARPATSPYGTDTGFTENIATVVQDFKRENLMGSRRAAFDERFNEQLDIARKLGATDLPAIPSHSPPTPEEMAEAMSKGRGDHGAILAMRAKKWDDFFAGMKQQHPDAGFMTIHDANDDISKDFADKRLLSASVRQRANTAGDVGAGLGYLAAPLQEPLVLATLPFGAAGSAGILRTMLIEAAVAGGTEAFIQPQVFDFKQQIDSPYTVGDAVTNVVTAGAGAGLIAGTIKAAPMAYRALLTEIQARRSRGELPAATPSQRAAENFLEQYVDEIESNPNRRDQPDSLPVHSENLRMADELIARGEGMYPDQVKTTRTQEPERRQNADQRQKIETLRSQIKEMTDRVDAGTAKPKELTKLLREMDSAIYTDPLTGIPNKRAWDEAEKKGFVASIDLDGFKVVNDVMGHDVGDDMLRLAGRILMEETGDAARKGGDEFAAQGGKGASLDKALKRAKDRLAQEKLTVTLPDGRQITKTGIDLTYAIGRDFKEADFNLQPLKDAKRKLRAERGGAVDGLVETPAARQQDNLNRGSSDRPATAVSSQSRIQGLARRSAESFDSNPEATNEIIQTEVQRLLSERPDMLVPDADGNMVPLKQLMDELTEDDTALEVVTACLKGAD
jgi:diguanylate cyclase (GGDEF)-like protein